MNMYHLFFLLRTTKHALLTPRFLVLHQVKKTHVVTRAPMVCFSHSILGLQSCNWSKRFVYHTWPLVKHVWWWPKQFCNPSWAIHNATAVLEQMDELDLLKEMQYTWKDISGRDADLWEHEFNKHATCMYTLNPSCYKNHRANISMSLTFSKLLFLWSLHWAHTNFWKRLVSFLLKTSLIPSKISLTLFTHIPTTLYVWDVLGQCFARGLVLLPFERFCR